MLNPITFQVDDGSGPLVVTTSGLDYAAYEDKYDKSALTALSSNKYSAVMFLVWHAMHRQAMTESTFEEFLNKSPMLERPEKAEDVPPLESPAPTGSQSTSPTSSD